jgi:hypothetical protein
LVFLSWSFINNVKQIGSLSSRQNAPDLIEGSRLISGTQHDPFETVSKFFKRFGAIAYPYRLTVERFDHWPQGTDHWESDAQPISPVANKACHPTYLKASRGGNAGDVAVGYSLPRHPLNVLLSKTL